MSLDNPSSVRTDVSPPLAPAPAPVAREADFSDPGDLLTVEVRSAGDRDVVTVTGEIDLATGPLLRDALTELLTNGRSDLVVDLDRVTFMDSTALGVLIAAHRSAASAQGTMTLVCNNPVCRRLFEMTGLTRLFTFTDLPPG